MKKALALILALVFVLCASASCKRGADDTGTKDTANDPDAVKEGYFWEGFGVGRDQLTIRFAQPFRDGAAWIHVSTKDGARGKMMLINTEGKVLYSESMQSGDFTPDRVTNICRGVSLYKDNGATYLIANDGRVVWCSEEDGRREAKRLFEGADAACISVFSYVNGGIGTFSADHETVKGSYFNGYAVVKITLADGSEKYGILSYDGSWLLSPSDMYVYSLEFNSVSAYTAFRYSTESDFLALDFKSGTMTDLGRKGADASGIIYPHQSAVTAAAQHGFELEKGGGLVYSKEDRSFVNADGAVVIDLSSYELAEKKRDGDEYIPYFYEGKCIVTFIADGKPYFTAFDSEGNRLFDPVPFPSSDLTDAENNRYAYISNGTLVFTKEPDPAYYMYGKSKYGVYYGEDGKIREDLGRHAEAYPFSDGIALTRNEAGEYEYIDTNGNVLFR